MHLRLADTWDATSTRTGAQKKQTPTRTMTHDVIIRCIHCQCAYAWIEGCMMLVDSMYEIVCDCMCVFIYLHMLNNWVLSIILHI